MWTREDFEKIFQYIKGDTPVELYEPLYALAKSDQATTKILFERTLDQVAFASEDYKRLRAFLIDWFSTHRTLTTIQKQISDLYVIPNDHLDELFRSYGYKYSNKLTYVNNRINYNKVNFFLDLVNLYKIKGTPASLVHALRYHGIPSLQIFEYMIKMNPGTEFIPDPHIYFESILAKSVGFNVDTPPTILTFSEATDWDPHWMSSQSKIIQRQNELHNHLPSKSPYFSLRIYMDMAQINLLFSYINRHIQEQYTYILTNRVQPQPDLFSVILDKHVNLLELYCSMIYIFNKTFPDAEYGNPNQNLIYRYNKDPHDVSTVISQFEYYHQEQPTRDDREQNIRGYYNDFTNSIVYSLFQSRDSAEEILTDLFPQTKNDLDGLLSVLNSQTLVGSLAEEFTSWVKTYFSIYIPNLGYLVLGQEELVRDLGGVIDFFKPYHARLLLTDFGLTFNDRLEESVRLKDYCIDSIEHILIDWDTCNSRPCCQNEDLECPTGNQLSYSRDTYDCGSYYDIGAACDPPGSFQTFIDQEIIDKIVERKHGEIDPNALIENVTTLTPDYAAQSGGFVVFDEGGYFDDQHACDVCFIQLVDVITPDIIFDFYTSENYTPPENDDVVLNVA